MVKILCTHVCKLKNEICRNYSRNGGGGKKRMMKVMNSTLIYCKNICKYHDVLLY
jgi:hypothetical protein